MKRIHQKIKLLDQGAPDMICSRTCSESSFKGEVRRGEGAVGQGVRGGEGGGYELERGAPRLVEARGVFLGPNVNTGGQGSARRGLCVYIGSRAYHRGVI